MKNSTRLFCFGGTLILLILLLIPFVSLAQDPSPVTSGGFFGKVGSWFKEGFMTTLLAIAGTLLAHKGYLIRAKMVARKSSIYLKGLGHLFTSAGEALDVADASINEDDTIDAKGLMDAIKKGKNVYIEGEEFIVSVKPKAVTK